MEDLPLPHAPASLWTLFISQEPHPPFSRHRDSVVFFLRLGGWLLKLDINSPAAPVFALCAELRVCIWELDSYWLPVPIPEYDSPP